MKSVLHSGQWYLATHSHSTSYIVASFGTCGAGGGRSLRAIARGSRARRAWGRGARGRSGAIGTHLAEGPVAPRREPGADGGVGEDWELQAHGRRVVTVARGAARIARAVRPDGGRAGVPPLGRDAHVLRTAGLVLHLPKERLRGAGAGGSHAHQEVCAGQTLDHAQRPREAAARVVGLDLEGAGGAVSERHAT